MKIFLLSKFLTLGLKRLEFFESVVIIIFVFVFDEEGCSIKTDIDISEKQFNAVNVLGGYLHEILYGNENLIDIILETLQ